MKPGRRSHEYAAAKPARTPGRVRTYQMSEWYVPNEVSMHVLELRSSHRHLWVIKCIVSLLHYRMHLACCRLVLACPAVVAAGARERAPRRRRAVASSPARRAGARAGPAPAWVRARVGRGSLPGLHWPPWGWHRLSGGGELCASALQVSTRFSACHPAGKTGHHPRSSCRLTAWCWALGWRRAQQLLW